MSKSINRRDFIKTSVLAGAGTLLVPKVVLGHPAVREKVRLGFIGTGMRGQWVLWLAAKRPDVEITSICDIDEGMIASALKILKDSGKPEPRVYNNGDEDFTLHLIDSSIELEFLKNIFSIFESSYIFDLLQKAPKLIF